MNQMSIRFNAQVKIVSQDSRLTGIIVSALTNGEDAVRREKPAALYSEMFISLPCCCLVPALSCDLNPTVKRMTPPSLIL